MLDLTPKLDYIGIRLRGLKHFLWFERDKFTTDSIFFKGTDGWGQGNADTSVEAPISEVMSVIHSDAIQND